MSISNFILKILNMKDENIKFNESFVEKRTIQNKRSLVFKGYLENNLEYCPLCGCVYPIKKNGTKTSMIKIPNVSRLTAYLELKKQIYKCKHCNHKITVKTPEIENRCRISNNTKYSIITYSKEAISHKLIASIHNVCNMTVQRYNNKIYDS